MTSQAYNDYQKAAQRLDNALFDLRQLMEKSRSEKKRDAIYQIIFSAEAQRPPRKTSFDAMRERMLVGLRNRFERSAEKFEALAVEAAKCNHDLAYIVERMLAAKAEKVTAHQVWQRMESTDYPDMGADVFICEYEDVKQELIVRLIDRARSTSSSTSQVQNYANDCDTKAIADTLASHAFSLGETIKEQLKRGEFADDVTLAAHAVELERIANDAEATYK